MRKSDSPIFNLLGHKTRSFLEKNTDIGGISKVIEWLDDSGDLLEYAKTSGRSYEDYTFVITPAFKALERWIFLIAPIVGIPENRVNNIRSEEKSVGGLLKDNELANLFEEVLNTVEITESIRSDLTTEVLGLKSFLKNYRHQVAHCWKELDLPEDAELHLNQVIVGIRRITDKLIEVGIIKKSE